MSPNEMIKQLEYIKEFHFKNKSAIYALNLAIMYLKNHFVIEEDE